MTPTPYGLTNVEPLQSVDSRTAELLSRQPLVYAVRVRSRKHGFDGSSQLVTSAKVGSCSTKELQLVCRRRGCVYAKTQAVYDMCGERRASRRVIELDIPLSGAGVVNSQYEQQRLMLR